MVIAENFNGCRSDFTGYHFFQELPMVMRSLLMSVFLGEESPGIMFLSTPFPDVDIISRPECVSLLSSYVVELNKL